MKNKCYKRYSNVKAVAIKKGSEDPESLIMGFLSNSSKTSKIRIFQYLTDVKYVKKNIWKLKSEFTVWTSHMGQKTTSFSLKFWDERRIIWKDSQWQLAHNFQNTKPWLQIIFLISTLLKRNTEGINSLYSRVHKNSSKRRHVPFLTRKFENKFLQILSLNFITSRETGDMHAKL